MKHHRLRLLTGAVLFGLLHTGQAACPLDGSTPMDIGPTDPVTTFPTWVQDSEGLALEICPGTDLVNCISDPPDPANPFSQQIGFGAEGFWGSAEAALDIPPGGALPGGGRALLVSAVEAAFGGEVPVDGDQFPFTRLRIRIDIPSTGTYVITHPWGQKTEVITTPGIRAINISEDVPFVANQVGFADGSIGPILTWDTFPTDAALDTTGDGIPDYIGTINFVNPATGGPEHAVTGSPCGTNLFRIEGPNIGGPGVNAIETDLFTVTGKLYTGPALPVPLAVNQATYSRGINGRANIFANAASSAELSFSGGAIVPAGPQPMTGDGSGRFFGTAQLNTTTGPGSVDVTAEVTGIAPALSPNTENVPLTDLVTITRAEYDYTTGDLTIEAHSSDLATPPTLSALGQTLTDGVLTIPGLTVAPPAVTVTSAAGGSATLPVTVIHAP